MINHLFNCHGEWGIVAATISFIPFIGIWLKTKITIHKERLHVEKEEENA